MPVAPERREAGAGHHVLVGGFLGFQQMFADAIVKIHDAYKDLTIVCIAGNHDSGSKHMIYHTPWKALNVHMIGSIVKYSDLDEYIIEVPGKGFVVAVPFAVDRYMLIGVEV